MQHPYCCCCDRTKGSLRREKERQFVETDRFDDSLRTLVGENSGYLQSLDTFIQPCYIAKTCACSLHDDFAVISMKKVVKHARNCAQAFGTLLRDQTTNK